MMKRIESLSIHNKKAGTSLVSDSLKNPLNDDMSNTV
jgi:hypothetical protein